MFLRALTLLLSAALITAYVCLSGCGRYCGDHGTREGAWGMVFRCSTGQRTQDTRQVLPENKTVF